MFNVINRKYLYSPSYFMVVKLLTNDAINSPLLCNDEYLSGPTVSSLYKLRDIDNSGKNNNNHHHVYK
jgi:hypothetical protein